VQKRSKKLRAHVGGAGHRSLQPPKATTVEEGGHDVMRTRVVAGSSVEEGSFQEPLIDSCDRTFSSNSQFAAESKPCQLEVLTNSISKILSGPGVTYASQATAEINQHGSSKLFHCPPKKVMKLVGQAVKDWGMIEDG